MNSVRNVIWRVCGTIRLAYFFVHTLYWLIYVSILSRWRGMKVEQGLEMRRRWASRLMRILHFDVSYSGEIPEDEPCLYVSNHRSSLDPLVVLPRLKAFPVSRAEVRNWPLVGKGSEITGVIFVDKSSRESRALARTAILDTLRNGHSVLIYPEGQTNVKPLTNVFQKGSFEQAAAGGFRVVPYVIEYQHKEDYWDHTDSFMVHFIKRFGKKHTPVRILFGPPVASDNAWTLLRTCQQWIDEHIVEVRKDWDEEHGETEVQPSDQADVVPGLH